MLYSIIYVSSAVRLMDDSELLDMLTKSRFHNAFDDISGILLYCNGNIVQVLEGEEDRVKATYQRISKDTRHAQVTTLYSGTIGGRSFNKWFMGFISLTSREMDELKNAVPFIDNPYCKKSSDQVFSLLQHFYINNLRN